MLIKSNSRKDIVRRQKNIIDYVNKHSDRHGTDASMKEAMVDYGKVSREGGLVKNPTVLKR